MDKAKTILATILILGLTLFAAGCYGSASRGTTLASATVTTAGNVTNSSVPSSPPNSNNETTNMPTSASDTSPSTVTFFEGSFAKRTFEELISFSDAFVIGRFISSTKDPDQTIDCLFQIDELIYGDIKEKIIHVHQLPQPDLRIDTNKQQILLLYIEDFVFYPHIRYYPMEQFQLSFDSKGNFKAENIWPDWPVGAFASFQAFKDATIKIKQKNLPVEKYAKAQVKYTREKDPKKIWDFSDHVAKVTIKALRGKGQYAWQYDCTVQSTLKGSPLPSEIWIHMLPGTEVGKTYLVLLVETTPGRSGTTYTISSIDSQILAGSPQEAVYSSLDLTK